MIRPAVITDEISQDFGRALDVMLEYGVYHAELRSLWGANVMDLTPSQLSRAKSALDERGMQVCSLASPLYKCTLYANDPAPGETSGAAIEERTLEQQLALLERAIELGQYFNTRLVRVFAFWRQVEATEAVLEAIVAALRPAVVRAEQAGLILGLENEHACQLGTGREVAGVLRAIGSPCLRVLWDPGNAYFSGEEPYPDGYEAIRPYLVHVHIKDAARGPAGKPQWVPVGDGEIDFRSLFSALVRDGYRGFVSLETHWKLAGGNSEESSRYCLAAMLKLLDEAAPVIPAAVV